MKKTALPVVPSNERPDLCGPCGGSCCKGMPGITTPEDWGAPNRLVMRKRLAAALSGGRYAIDWWEGDLDGFDTPEYVRPATRGNEGLRRDPSWGGACTFLVDGAGCSLSFAGRPHECRALEPREGGAHACKSTAGGKREHAAAWIPYQDVIDAAQEEAA